MRGSRPCPPTLPAYDRAVPDQPLSDARLDAALSALMEPARFQEAEARVAGIAPQLQHILASVLREGGYFDQAHETQVDRVAGIEDEDARRRELRTLLAEETRIGMLVGVAVGWELNRELDDDGKG